MGTLTITAVPTPDAWVTGTEIELTATLTETVASASVDWSVSDSTLASFTSSTNTPVTSGVAAIKATALASGAVTFTATGDSSEGSTGNLSGTITDATAAATYTPVINSDSHFWGGDKLLGFEKSFSVVVLDATTSLPVTGLYVGVTCDALPALEHLNKNAISDEHGIVTVLLKLTGAGIDTPYTLVFNVLEDADIPGSVSGSDTYAVEVVGAELPPPFYQLATDSVIDDADIEAGVFCDISASGLQARDVCYLRLDGYTITHTVSDADIDTGTIFIPVGESLLTNGLKQSFYYVVSPSGNASFSDLAQFFVDRDNEGVGIMDLDGLIVTQAEDGYINKLDADLGVTVEISDPQLSENKNDGNAANLVCKGYRAGGVLISTTIAPFATDGTDSVVLEDSDESGLDWQLHDLFYAIGQGYVEMTYEIGIMNDDTGKIEKHSSEPVTYTVDVVPPGNK